MSALVSILRTESFVVQVLTSHVLRSGADVRSFRCNSCGLAVCWEQSMKKHITQNKGGSDPNALTNTIR